MPTCDTVPATLFRGTHPGPGRPHRIGTLRVVPEGRCSLGDAVVKVGDPAAKTPLIEQLEVKTRVTGEGVFAAS